MNQQSLFPELESEETSDFAEVNENSPKFVSYGGGVNSTALLVLLKSQGIVPDGILFADTGGEHPHTYAYLEIVDQWLESIGFPKIITVKYPGTDKYSTLEDDCLSKNVLPSKAYGYSKCSAKWKVEPQRKYIKSLGLTERYIFYVGIHAGETRRLRSKAGSLKITETKEYSVQYPLIEQGIHQHHCIALIQAVGLPVPKKSSCFFCPAMKPTEILELKRDYPELYERALKIEAEGMKTAKVIKGLGRKFAWKDVGKLTDIEQAILDAQTTVCGCVEEF